MEILLLLLNFYFAATLGVAGIIKIEAPKLFENTLRHQNIVPAKNIFLISLYYRTEKWLM